MDLKKYYYYKKKHSDLPGQKYYRYDCAFKKKIIADIDAGLISSGQASKLYSFDRKNIARWRKELKLEAASSSLQIKRQEEAL